MIFAIAIIGILVTLILPAIQAARETARRSVCSKNLREIMTAVLGHEAATRSFPAGATVSDSDACDGCFDPWGEARRSGTDAAGKSGSSWMLSLMPRINEAAITSGWDRSVTVSANAQFAAQNIEIFYCPTRRTGIRSSRGDGLSLPSPSWKGGGTDYGACLGRRDGFVNGAADTISGRHRFQAKAATDAITEGVFRANLPVGAGMVSDGLSNTIALGELQRLRPAPGVTGDEADAMTSQDGWAVGGVATLFTTATDPDNGNPGGLNNGFFESPGSDHRGGAYFAFGDGSVRFISDYVDARDNTSVFALLGSVRDGSIATLVGSGF